MSEISGLLPFRDRYAMARMRKEQSSADSLAYGEFPPKNETARAVAAARASRRF
jgi:hypothetical protein